MITATKKLNVERSAAFPEHQFKIQASAQAFAILSDGLYQNKIGSIIRELSTNAADSHIMADNPKPFRVKLPSRLDPVFEIRDFGIGLSEEQLNTIYTTYFASDKTNSNELTGCLGLGSKSPFSYTDSFNVTSFYNGTKYECVAAMNEDGIPSFLKINEESTDEPNGLSVQFPVSSPDISTFSENARNVYRHFNQKPEIVGNTSFRHYDEEEYTVEGKGWKLYNKQDYHDEALAVMGNVAYPIDFDNLNVSRYDNTGKRYDRICDLPIAIEFNIGDIEMTASRESLSYKKRTINAIIAKFDSIYAELEEVAQKEIDKCETLWQARCKNRELRNGKMGYFAQDCTYEGHKLSERIELKCGLSSISYAYAYRSHCDKVKVNHKCMSVECSDNVMFVMDDCVGAAQRCAYLLEQSQNNNKAVIYLLKFHDGWDGILAIKQLGIDPRELILASSFQKRPSVRGTTRRKQTETVYEFKHQEKDRWGPDLTMNSYWNEHPNYDMSKGGIYVEMRRWSAKHEGGSDYEPSSLHNVINRIATLSGKKIEVFGVRGEAVSNIKKSSGTWINLFDYITQQVEKFDDKYDINYCLLSYEQIQKLSDNYGSDQGRTKTLKSINVTELDDTKPFFHFCKKLQKNTQNIKL